MPDFMRSLHYHTPLRLVLAFGALCALLAVTAVPAAAQEPSTSDGSLYSRYGLGELQSFPSSQINAMGGGGSALLSLNYVNVANPATWSYQVLTRASAGARFQNLEMTDEAGNTSRLTGGSITNLHFGLPILSNRLGLVVAFEPFSRTNYRVQTVDSLQLTPSDSEMIPYRVDYEGTGGLQQLRGGAGLRVNDNLRVGASIDMVFGIMQEGRRTTFASGNDLRPTNRVNATRLYGATGTAGVMLSEEDVLANSDQIGLAASFTFPLRLSGERVRTIGDDLARDTLGVAEQGNLDLPWRLSAGASYATAERWQFVLDATYEPWSDFSSDFDQFPVMGNTGSYGDRLRLSGGVEVLPGGTDEMASLLGRIAYRLGAYYDGAYFSPAENIDLNTTALTGGISLPTMADGSRLDLNVEVGTRGVAEQGLVRDLFYTVSATLNIGERWFLRQRLQ